MKNVSDPQLSVIFSFFERLHRKAPGSAATTRRALKLLKHLPRHPRVVEFGCGSGASALVLATAGANVTAVDIHQPFLDDLQCRAAENGLSDRITTVCADMEDPPFDAHTFDLIWSEGAIYLVGFGEGLRRWRPLLKQNSFLAVSHAAWLDDSPPRKAVEFWNSGEPGIRSVAENVQTLCAAGYKLVDHFVLPKEDWDDYYGPLQEELTRFRQNHHDNPVAEGFADSMQREIDIWHECGDSYGYVFYLARVTG